MDRELVRNDHASFERPQDGDGALASWGHFETTRATHFGEPAHVRRGVEKKNAQVNASPGGGACKTRVVLPTHRACLCKGNPKTHRRPLMYGTTPPPFVKPPSLGPPQQSCGQTTRGRGRTGAKMGAARKRGHAVAGQGLARTGVRTLCMHRGGAPRPQSKTDALSTENVPAPSLPPHCPPWPLRLACWIHGGGGAWPVREKGARAPSL